MSADTLPYYIIVKIAEYDSHFTMYRVCKRFHYGINRYSAVYQERKATAFDSINHDIIFTESQLIEMYKPNMPYYTYAMCYSHKIFLKIHDMMILDDYVVFFKNCALRKFNPENMDFLINYCFVKKTPTIKIHTSSLRNMTCDDLAYIGKHFSDGVFAINYRKILQNLCTIKQYDSFISACEDRELSYIKDNIDRLLRTSNIELKLHIIQLNRHYHLYTIIGYINDLLIDEEFVLLKKIFEVAEDKLCIPVRILFF